MLVSGPKFTAAQGPIAAQPSGLGKQETLDRLQNLQNRLSARREQVVREQAVKLNPTTEAVGAQGVERYENSEVGAERVRDVIQNQRGVEKSLAAQIQRVQETGRLAPTFEIPKANGQVEVLERRNFPSDAAYLQKIEEQTLTVADKLGKRYLDGFKDYVKDNLSWFEEQAKNILENKAAESDWHKKLEEQREARKAAAKEAAEQEAAAQGEGQAPNAAVMAYTAQAKQVTDLRNMQGAISRLTIDPTSGQVRAMQSHNGESGVELTTVQISSVEGAGELASAMRAIGASTIEPFQQEPFMQARIHQLLQGYTARQAAIAESALAGSSTDLLLLVA